MGDLQKSVSSVGAQLLMQEMYLVVADCEGSTFLCGCSESVRKRSRWGSQIFVTARKEQNKTTLVLGHSEVD